MNFISGPRDFETFSTSLKTLDIYIVYVRADPLNGWKNLLEDKLLFDIIIRVFLFHCCNIWI